MKIEKRQIFNHRLHRYTQMIRLRGVNGDLFLDQVGLLARSVFICVICG
jgi:hypothetical protein